MIEKSANQLWRESGTTLSFKDWLTREKRKFVNFNGDAKKPSVLMVNKPLNEEIQKTIGDIRKDVGYKTTESGKSVFGVNKTLIILVGVSSLAFITYKVIQSIKA
jgi:hypothetical protein